MNPPTATDAPPSERSAQSYSSDTSRTATHSDRDLVRVYATALGRHLGLVIGIPIVFAAVALVVVLLRPRPFVARAAFIASEPASASSSLGALSAVASQLGIPALSQIASSSATGSAQFYGDLLTSQAMLNAVATTRYEATSTEAYGGEPFQGTLIDYVKPTGFTATDRTLATMNTLAKRIIAVTVDRPTGIVRIQVRTKNRQLSALIARRLLDLVNDFNLRRRQTQAGAEREFSARRAQSALDSLHTAETALADFRSTNIDFSRSPRLGTREAELQRRVTLAQQIYTTVAQRYEMANIEAVRNTPVVTVLDAPEGLVEARPRYTAAIAAAAGVIGLLIGCVLAIRAERFTIAR